MQFPPLKAGQRHTLPRPFGSADAPATAERVLMAVKRQQGHV